jgi:hypothetical protein
MPEELWILVIVHGSVITPLLRDKGRVIKTLQTNKEHLVATVAGWKGKQQAGYW